MALAVMEGPLKVILVCTMLLHDIFCIANSSEDNRGYGDQGQNGYSQTPPAQYQSEPPKPSYQPPSDKPPLPEGWKALFDQNYQRWYYLETATGKTQWEAPPPPPPPPAPISRPGEDASRGYSDYSQQSSQSGYGGQGYGGPQYGNQGGYGGPNDGSRAGPGGYGGAPMYGQQGSGGNNPYPQGGENKSSSKSGMLMGAAGGLVVGGLAGAALNSALSDDKPDQEVHNNYYGAPPAAQVAPAPAPGIDDSYTAPHEEGGVDHPPAFLPATDADGNSVSSSDREEVQEARAEYEDALAAAADSDASSSDHEAAREAYEEYQERYEEVYEDE